MSSSSESSSSAANVSAARRAADFDGPSSSRRRGPNEIWPEHFIESLAVQVAVDASRSIGRLSAAAALATVFRVCSTWRAVSRSELLWRRLTRLIWGRTTLFLDTWQDEYVYWHRTAQNFRLGRSSHAVLHFDPSGVENADGLVCRCLTFSDNHLACGFSDGTVRVFDLTTFAHVHTFRPIRRDLRGRYSQAVAGIVMISDHPRVVFATVGGDVHMAMMNNGGAQPPRRAHMGDVENDGPLLEFAGCGRWWVGLYAGVPGRSFRIWDGNNEELMFVGGSLTDPDAVVGWYTLIEWSASELVGRVRVTGQESALACTGSRMMTFDLRNQGMVFFEEDFRRGRGPVVGSFDVSSDAYMVVDRRGWARVRRVDTLEEVCRFRVSAAATTTNRPFMGCMNRGFALICAGGAVRVWEAEHGEPLFSMGDGLGEVNAFRASDRHVAAAGSDTRIHLWDFGAQ